MYECHCHFIFYCHVSGLGSAYIILAERAFSYGFVHG